MVGQSGIIVFDLDGTLVDSNRDLIPALNRTIGHDGLPPISRDAVGHVVGKGALEMIRRAHSFHGHDLDPARERELLEIYLAEYEAHIADETVYFDGVGEALDRLAEKGWRFAICTNKFEHLARKLIGLLGGLERFATITGGDTFENRKPHPDHIRQTLHQAGGSVETSIMVGDSINDIAAARDVPMRSIAVDFGYTDIPPSELGADIVISHYDELPKAVENLSLIT